MTQENSCAPCVKVIVVGNEKGGSGKSTVAIHLAIALLKSGQNVATIDLDWRQRSFTHYIDNRLAWSRQRGKELLAPTHICFDEEAEFLTEEDEAAGRAAFANTYVNLAANHGYIIIDTPGHNHYLTRLAHTMADILITPLNDSFVDLDVLGSVDPENFSIAGISHYAPSSRTRAASDRPPTGRTPIGSCCATGWRRFLRATSALSATRCRTSRNGSASAASRVWPNG